MVFPPLRPSRVHFAWYPIQPVLQYGYSAPVPPAEPQLNDEYPGLHPTGYIASTPKDGSGYCQIIGLISMAGYHSHVRP